ncbi:hypothetical protein [Grimontia celer]|uniref:hypothetical protein n=1 Tax=Grimontia celer TaxID=1796497 RepID=UPI0018D41866|nr:hypothetical protein [Grimontia celer]
MYKDREKSAAADKLKSKSVEEGKFDAQIASQEKVLALSKDKVTVEEDAKLDVALTRERDSLALKTRIVSLEETIKYRFSELKEHEEERRARLLEILDMLLEFQEFVHGRCIDDVANFKQVAIGSKTRFKLISLVRMYFEDELYEYIKNVQESLIAFENKTVTLAKQRDKQSTESFLSAEDSELSVLCQSISDMASEIVSVSRSLYRKKS